MKHAVLAALALAACGPPLGIPRVVVSPGEQRSGEDGTDGPFGAAYVEMKVRARVSDVYSAEVLFPSDDAGAAAELALPAPVVLLEPGGLVSPERYRWLGAHLATRGYIAVLPSHAANLAILDPDNGLYALEELYRLAEGGPKLLDGAVDLGAPVTAMGHSLGGVVAAKQWSREPAELGALVMLASWAAGNDPVGDRPDSPVLMIVGSTDVGATSGAVEEHLADFGGTPWHAEVQGLNHYGWTDSFTTGELAGDGPLEGDLSSLRQAALRVIDPFLDGVLSGSVADQMPSAPEGVEVSW